MNPSRNKNKQTPCLPVFSLPPCLMSYIAHIHTHIHPEYQRPTSQLSRYLRYLSNQPNFISSFPLKAHTHTHFPSAGAYQILWYTHTYLTPPPALF